MLERKNAARCVTGEITEMPVEAIVNAVNSHLWMGSGPASVIKARAGADIEKEAMAKGPIKLGQALSTSAGQLPSPIRRILHVAAFGPEMETDLSTVRTSTLAALQLAENEGISRLAMPVLGSGPGGLPVSSCALLMEGTIETFLDTAESLHDVYLVFQSPSELAEFRLRQPQ